MTKKIVIGIAALVMLAGYVGDSYDTVVRVP
jgi:hypothetical protein